VAGHHLSVARCRLSWGLAALRGLEPVEPGRLLVSVRPGGVSTPFGCSFDEPLAHDFAVVHRPSLRFPAPPETCHSSPAPQRHRPPVPKDRRATRPAMLPLLGFRALRHIPGLADPLSLAADPSATACHVRGLATSFAASTTSPPGARGAGASMGFALQGVPLAARGAPLGVPALLTLPSVPPPEGSEPERPPSGPSSRNESVLSSSPSRRKDPTVDTFLSFSSPEHSPQPPGRSLVVTMPALSPLGGMTSLPTWATGLRGSVESAWSVSGLPALLRFRTF
jgi:hypothetical protein